MGCSGKLTFLCITNVLLNVVRFGSDSSISDYESDDEEYLEEQKHVRNEKVFIGALRSPSPS